MDENYYRRRFIDTFLDKEVSEYRMQRYIEGDVLQLQDFIGMHLKSEHTWMTCIGLIDAMDDIIKSVKREGRLHI